MATKKKMLQAAAGNATGGAGGLNVEDVFSTYLYDGTGDNQTNTVTNGLDLSGEGGMVWTKCRNIVYSPIIFDSERGLETYLYTDGTSAQANNDARSNMSFNSDGYSFGSASATSWGPINEGTGNFASWTFRKAPKFFDVVTYTGTGSPQTIAHNLGSVPGCIITKVTDDATGWAVYHRGNTSAPETERLILEENYATSDDNAYWNDTAPTSTHFTVGTTPRTNSNGKNIVAYLFAHNDGDGEFGPDGDADIIKCGSYTHAYAGAEVNLGFEPQWILFKAANQSSNWFIFDAMRGIVTGGLSGDGDAALFPNTSDAENVNAWGVDLTPTGFIAYGNNIASSGDIIYIAIRRGTKVPESGTEVFDVTAYSGASAGTSVTTGFPVDATLVKCRDVSSTSTEVWDRLRGSKAYLFTDSTAAEATAFTSPQWLIDDMDGFTWSATDGFSNLSGRTFASWTWKRAPNFFDVVAYTGDGTAGQTVSHNLGVAPEMIWIKSRSNAENWQVWHSSVTGNLELDNTTAVNAASVRLENVTDTSFGLKGFNTSNGSGQTYIAYLFASLDGVSKVGSYNGTGAAFNVDCGFTSGARFVLIKRATGVGSWKVYDTDRGIDSGGFDKELRLDDTSSETTGEYIAPYSGGFALPASVSNNLYGETYIFYAVA